MTASIEPPSACLTPSSIRDILAHEAQFVMILHAEVTGNELQARHNAVGNHIPRDITARVWPGSSAYRTGATEKEAITLTRMRDGAIWRFSASGVPTGAFFTVNTQGYGVPYCIIFRPEKTLSYLAGDSFSVTVTGLQKIDGTADTLSWQTDLFSLPGFQHYYYRR